ncbi:MAG: DUF481 domain-containing protein [Planctomycetaceae bacterium]
MAALAGILLAVAAPRAPGAEPAAILHLSNGDRLTGRQVGIEDGRLRWRLSHGPEIAIPLSAVKRIERAEATAAESSGTGWTTRGFAELDAPDSDAPDSDAPDFDDSADVDEARDQPSDDEKSRVASADAEVPADHEESGVEPASMFQRDATFVGPPPPGEAYAPFTGPMQPSAALPPNPMFARPEDPDAIDETDSYFASAWNAIRVRSADTFVGFADWTEHLEAGGRTLSGNTQEDYITAGAKFSKTTVEQTALLEFGGQWSQSDGKRRSNRWWGNGTVDYNKKGNWLFFMTTKNEYDEFENLTWRGTLAAGPGYRIVNEPERRFIVRAGPAVTREMYFDPRRDRSTADILGEFEVVTPLWWDRLLWEHKTTAIPSVDDFSLIRITTASDLSFKIDEEARWHVKLGFRHEYNAQPNPGRERGDLTTSLFLVYKRK